MTVILYVEPDRPGEVQRLTRETAEANGERVLLVFPKLLALKDGAADDVRKLFTSHPNAAALVTGSVPEEIGLVLLETVRQLFCTPRARLGSIAAAELSVSGGAELVQSPRHAAERLQAAGSSGGGP